MVTPSPRPAPRRRGFALMDCVVAGILLAVGLAAILSLGSRALSLQQRGEREIVAASLLDELLSDVLTEGPAEYARIHPLSGRFDEPFSEFDFELTIEDGSEGVPFKVRAEVRHASGNVYACETLVAAKLGENPDPQREPSEPIDRESRYDENEG
jgi:hypothetical protein